MADEVLQLWSGEGKAEVTEMLGMLREFLPSLPSEDLIFLCLKLVYEGVVSIECLAGTLNNYGHALRLHTKLTEKASPPTFGDVIGAGDAFCRVGLVMPEAMWVALVSRVQAYQRLEVDSIPNILAKRPRAAAGQQAADDSDEEELQVERAKRIKRKSGMHASWRSDGRILVGDNRESFTEEHLEILEVFDAIFTVTPRLGRRIL